MCMANMAAAPLNALGSFWGDEDLGSKYMHGTLAGRTLEYTDKALQGPTIKSPTVTGPQQVQEVSAQQRRSLIS